MHHLTKGKLLMSLITPDLIEEWNTAVRARHLYVILDYTNHIPTLWIGAEGVDPEVWMTLNTRTHIHKYHAVKHETLRLGVMDLVERFAKHEARLFIKHSKNKQKQQFASLGITAQASGAITTVLVTIKKGTKKDYVHFALNDRW
ncbi:hypothetical protein PP740_gp094 [Stenotrophomonas phage Philippe]|uniref:Uncharacterized protein n=1 Tax=Stenotrophomonas phage Philippe TaxID=2859655 RepID=A0AAE8BLP6_9CAUD|nr:hypothetical protein PP740_gp094 [Stenotrophomonas phage Philippe]QYW02248.1 hypothetical protein CPT_Philippe_055 [Stenotrophomonas phage Philippe]